MHHEFWCWNWNPSEPKGLLSKPGNTYAQSLIIGQGHENALHVCEIWPCDHSNFSALFIYCLCINLSILAVLGINPRASTDLYLQPLLIFRKNFYYMFALHNDYISCKELVPFSQHILILRFTSFPLFPPTSFYLITFSFEQKFVSLFPITSSLLCSLFVFWASHIRKPCSI